MVNRLRHQDPHEPQGRPTFVLADLLDPGEGVYLHQRVWDADHVHHVHDALKSRTDTARGQGGGVTRGKAACLQQAAPPPNQGSRLEAVRRQAQEQLWSGVATAGLCPLGR